MEHKMQLQYFVFTKTFADLNAFPLPLSLIANID